MSHLDIDAKIDEKDGVDTGSLHSKDTTQIDHNSIDKDVEKLPKEENTEQTVADPNIVNWDGPDDPANPMNWSSKEKITAIGTVSLITFLSPLASTIISPATEDVLKDFNSTNETLGAFVTTVYLLGYTFGPLVIAPLSEMYGRVIMYNACNTIFLIFSIACAVANNLSALIVFRLLAGIGASGPVTLGGGSIADMVPVEKRGFAMMFWIMGPIMGPTFGPLAGSYLAEAKGWRWIFWLLTICAGAVWVACIILLRESYAFVILQRKTNRLIKETGNTNLRSALDTGRTPNDLLKISLIRPLKMLIFSPIVLLIAIYVACIYGDLYLMFTTFPRVYQGQYGFSDGTVGLVYLGTGIGSFAGLVFCGITMDRTVKRMTKRNGGPPRPEYRLPPMLAGAFVVPTGLFLYAWTAQYKVHWILPIIGSGILGFGMFLVFMPSNTYLVDAYTQYAASAIAATTVLRSLLGALLPLAGNAMYNALGLGWGTSVLGFIAAAFIPMPFVLWKYGKQIRESRMFQVKF